MNDEVIAFPRYMSLRDYYIGQAMISLGHIATPERAAEMAIELADAVLAKRGNQSEASA